MDKVQMFKEITEEMTELYERKNSDYGDSVHDTYVKYGPVSFLVRMEDKINRVRQLTDREYTSRVRDEKIKDSLIDLANYAILMIIEMERENSMRVSCADYTIEPTIKMSSGLAYIKDGGQLISGMDLGKVDEDLSIWSFETKKDEE